MSNLLSRINPFYKFLFLMVFATVITFIHSFWLNVWVFAVCVLLILIGVPARKYLQAVKILIPVTIMAASLFMMGALFGREAGDQFGQITTAATQSGINMATRLYSFVGLGLLLTLSTDVYDLVKSLQKDAKLPRKFAYGMLCALHLFPYMKKEYQQTKLALQVRGARVGIFSLKPLFAMLVNAFRWSEMLSIAMISKGFDEET